MKELNTYFKVVCALNTLVGTKVLGSFNIASVQTEDDIIRLTVDGVSDLGFPINEEFVFTIKEFNKALERV